MLRFLVICGCLVAVARAGVIGGGLLAATAPAVAVQSGLPAATLAVPTISATSSNIIRAPVAAIAAPGLLAGPALAAGLAAPLGLNGLALNGLGAIKVL